MVVAPLKVLAPVEDLKIPEPPDRSMPPVPLAKGTTLAKVGVPEKVMAPVPIVTAPVEVKKVPELPDRSKLPEAEVAPLMMGVVNVLPVSVKVLEAVSTVTPST